ncbi:MAG TPA: NADH-quinone oxidoreductase subunit NuoF [Egicoccus sp.]|nr:NADH-quinone oxidoreductase subunit NuoF [Egicoccus sp.]HSK22481.1 NADH-quinone oxidoreductase subunit NuoF [Egicoccus sp.]
MGQTGPCIALTERYGIEGAHDIEVYEQHGGYVGLRKALEMTPTEIIDVVKEAGVRGRGGAGFPTGMKWSFVAQDTGKPVYIVCNADEGEPGTFKDRELMEKDPHQLVEGMVVGGLALNSVQGYIYLRGEFAYAGRRMAEAIRQAYAKGYLGANVMGSGKRFDLTLHRGAGAYICGEETALLDSLEGRRGQPRLRPPFPATHGLYGCPTTVNNVESISSVPFILRHGVEWYRQWGTEKSPGPKLMCISGEVDKPGNYEFALGTPVIEMVEACGGMREGRQLKFFCPGGSSTPMLPASKADVAYTYEDIMEAGSMLGTGALMVYSDKTCVVDTVLRFTEFYEHESCGKCTPCREGGYWLSQILRRIETGTGRMEDLDLLQDVCDNVFGRSFCALGDGMTSSITSGLQYFREEFEAHIREHRCPLGTTEPRTDIPMLEVHGGAGYAPETGAAQIPAMPARSTVASGSGRQDIATTGATDRSVAGQA